MQAYLIVVLNWSKMCALVDQEALTKAEYTVQLFHFLHSLWRLLGRWGGAQRDPPQGWCAACPSIQDRCCSTAYDVWWEEFLIRRSTWSREENVLTESKSLQCTQMSMINHSNALTPSLSFSLPHQTCQPHSLNPQHLSKKVYSSSLIFLSSQIPLSFHSSHLNWSATSTLECTAPVKCRTICSDQLHFHKRINRVSKLLHLRKIPCRNNEDLEGRVLRRSECDNSRVFLALTD